MKDEGYEKFVEKIEWLIFKSGKPFYIIAPQIGISDKTLRRFLDRGNVTIYTVLQIAEFFKINVFGKYSEKVD